MECNHGDSCFDVNLLVSMCEHITCTQRSFRMTQQTLYSKILVFKLFEVVLFWLNSVIWSLYVAFPVLYPNLSIWNFGLLFHVICTIDSCKYMWRRLIKGLFNAHQGYTYLLKNTIQTVIFRNIMTILKNCFLF